MENEYISPARARHYLNVTSETLRSWDNQGKIRTIRTPSGFRNYSMDDIKKIIGSNVVKYSIKRRICYCRVSSKKQSDDLERQEEYMKEKFPNHEIISDIGSGLNWKRIGLKSILEQSMLGNVEEVVVAHRDRLCRFGFELVEFIFEKNKTRLFVVDTDGEKSSNAELAEDIISIIHIYSCRAMGKRKYRKKQEQESQLECIEEEECDN